MVFALRGVSPLLKILITVGRQADEAEKAQQSTIKKKGMNELKGLVFDMNSKAMVVEARGREILT